MSTFFEKLTGSKTVATPPVAADPSFVVAPKVAAPKRAPAQKNPPAPEKTTHLKVNTEETAVEEEGEEEMPEEEGELTVDIYDRGDEIVIQSTVAGVRPEDLDVSITSDTITIRGRRERQEEMEEDRYYYKELFWGTFSRTVILPEEIDDDGAEASLRNGLLTLRLPKRRRGVVQKLKVKVT